MKVWVKATNATGGILGRQVKLIAEDTKSDPTANLTATKKLISQDKVVALFPGGSQTAGLKAVVEAAKVPLIGGQNTDTAFSSQYHFPAGTSTSQQIAALVKVGKKYNSVAKGGEFYCAESPSCAASVDYLKATGEKLGAPVVYAASITATQPDFTAVCLAALNAGVNYIFVAHAAAIANRVITACTQNNFFPTYVAPAFDKSYLENPSISGKVNLIGIFQDALFSGPAAFKFRAAVAKYDPGLANSPSFGQFAYQAWLSGELMKKAIIAAKPKGNTITRADILRGLYALKDETLGLQTPPLNYKKGQPADIKCFFTGKVSSGTVTQQGGAQC
jgi:branched-chain amino acid transport system substrate-binding protein